MTDIGLGLVGTGSGRYWAMDRDGRWDRTQRAWEAIADGEGERASSAIAAIQQAYAAGVTDEFIPPTVIVDDTGMPLGQLGDGDGVVMFNFRADRMRQLLAVLTDPDFDRFPRTVPSELAVATMTEYVRDQAPPIAFPPQDVETPLARVLSEAGLRQFHTAETEKYAHVTYFFNGGREAPFDGEERLMVPSPHVATYDLQPEMSAPELTDRLVARIGEGVDDFIIVNYANPDMVGHSGVLEAAMRAVATVDECLARVLDAVLGQGGTAIITADHGNAETMIDPQTGGPHTSHTLNPVPIILVGASGNGDADTPLALRDGRLSDVAPTILEIMNLPAPAAMTGHSLIDRGPG
jgi:2,3-bisphosphoglycerate-independent phosphoglycerate mutase